MGSWVLWKRTAKAMGLAVAVLACSKSDSTKSSSFRFNRVISPIPTKKTLDAEYRDKALALNARYYYLLGEYLTRKKEFKGALQALERAREFNESEPEIYFSLATIYGQWGKREETEALLRRTLELDPNHFGALLELAQSIKGNESMGEVRALFERAAKVDPNSDEAVLGLVVLEMAGKHHKQARKMLTEFLKRRPDSHLGHFYLGTMDQDEGHFRAAEKNYKRALDLRPDFSRAAAFLGQIYEAQNRSEEALKLFEDAAQYGQGATFYKRIGEMQADRKESQKARDAFEAYLAVDKDNTEILLRLAFLALEAKDFDNAEDKFQRLVELRPEFSAAHYFVGILREEKKDYVGALASLKKVQLGSNVSWDAHKAIGRVQLGLKNYAEGEEYFKKLYSQDPKVSKVDREKVASELVGFLAKAKKFKEAMDFAASALETFPNSEELHFSKAMALEEQGKAMLGAEQLEVFLENHKVKNAAILNFVGYVYAEAGVHLEKAERLIRQAQKLRPEDPYIADSLGWVLFQKGDYKSAETWLRRAVAGAPEEVTLIEHLADCLVKNGQVKEATEQYAKALNLGHKKDGDQRRLQEKYQAQCGTTVASGFDACRRVREPRSPASATR